MKMRKERKWTIEDTKQSNIEGTKSRTVSGEEGENKGSKRKGKNKWLEGGKSNDIEQGPQPKRKKKSKTKKVKKVQAIQNSDGNKEKCIIYLKKWHEDRQNWKFEKLRQIWLFRNMLNPLKVSTNMKL
jgi:hypothetical protein